MASFLQVDKPIIYFIKYYYQAPTSLGEALSHKVLNAIQNKVIFL
jgi:hypothetical protein